MYIDTHCHLNLKEHFPNPAGAVERAIDAGVKKMVVVGIDDETSRISVELSEQFEEAYACVGWHPTSAANFVNTHEIERLCGRSKTVAIGEIGLDYYWDKSTPEQQIFCLDAHWELACNCEMPVVFHCRDAYGELLDWLSQRKKFPPVYVLHCFAGSSAEARAAIDLGCYFGVDGPITFKNAIDLRETIATIPRDRVLVETDAPFLTPHPHRGKPNEPAMIPLICACLAAVWGVPTEDARRITTENALRAFPRLG